MKRNDKILHYRGVN
ncbi:hypothetical protein ACVVCL_000203 [Escherichia coli]